VPDSSSADDGELTELEASVVAKLLDGDHPALAALREQVRGVRVIRREFTGSGFHTFLAVAPGAEAAPVARPKAWVGDVLAAIDGLEEGAGFVLFVHDGQLDHLEGYTFDEPWPDDVGGAVLSYVSASRRVWANLDPRATD
jgi:hypothetical protein